MCVCGGGKILRLALKNKIFLKVMMTVGTTTGVWGGVAVGVGWGGVGWGWGLGGVR